MTRKSRIRGATMIEALIVIAMVTTFLAVGMFLHSAYVHKLAAMRDARAGAWQASQGGCSGGLSGGLVATGMGLVAMSLPANAQPPSLGFSIGASVVPKSYDVAQAPLIGGRRFAMMSESRVACNEVNPPFADLAGLAQWATSELVP